MSKRLLVVIIVAGFVIGASLSKVRAQQQYPQGTMIIPTIPGTDFPSYRGSGYVLEGNTWHSTYPGTGMRNYKEPSYTVAPPAYSTIPRSVVPQYVIPQYLPRQ